MEVAMRSGFRILFAFALLLLFATTCVTPSVRTVKYSVIAPESVGLSSEHLEQITKKLEEDVAKGMIPGAVVLVARKGKIAYLISTGYQNKKTGIPMSRDSIFRIYSMTKPIVTVAILMLYEEGKLKLSDPLFKYLPEFKNMKVGVEIIDKETGDIEKFITVPAKRQITIQDLLTHTSGFTYGFIGTSSVKQMYLKAGILNANQTLAEFVNKLSKIPLFFQPGTKWDYSRSTDVLGRVVEVVSGMTLDRFLEEMIFRPLGMKDSGFYVKKEDIARLTEPVNIPPALLKNATALPKMLSGGGGLVSTVDDYYRFLHMLLNGGEIDGRRILKKETITLMTRDHLGTLSKRTDPFYRPGKGYGFGIGFAVRKEQKGWKDGSVGDYWWGGFAGTYFWVDPKEELITIFMIQNPSLREHYRPLMRDLVYKAIKGRR
jgi:CubicO group peptidase (beta-lactamase class C family)